MGLFGNHIQSWLHPQVLATRTEAPEIIGALGTLSTFYEENTTHAQRRLRQTIQQHDLSVNMQFLTAVEDIVKAGGSLELHKDSSGNRVHHVGLVCASTRHANPIWAQ